MAVSSAAACSLQQRVLGAARLQSAASVQQCGPGAARLQSAARRHAPAARRRLVVKAEFGLGDAATVATVGALLAVYGGVLGNYYLLKNGLEKQNAAIENLNNEMQRQRTELRHALWEQRTELRHACWEQRTELRHALWQQRTELRHALWEQRTELRQALWEQRTELRQALWEQRTELRQALWEQRTELQQALAAQCTELQQASSAQRQEMLFLLNSALQLNNVSPLPPARTAQQPQEEEAASGSDS